MSDLENLWDDLPVRKAPVEAIVREARRTTAARRRNQLHLRRSLRGAATVGAVAAAFAAGLVINQTGGSGGDLGPAGPDGPDFTPAAFNGALEAPESCDELLASYVRRGLERVTAWGWDGPAYGYLRRDGFTLNRAFTPERARLSGDLSGAVAFDSAQSKAMTAQSNSATGTNVQEAGVDEPDLVKTDGETLYRLRGAELLSFDVGGKDVRPLDRVDLGGLRGGRILLAGDTVLAIGTPGPGEGRARVIAIDVRDPGAMSERESATFDATTSKVRQVGTTVRLVMSAGLPNLEFEEAKLSPNDDAPTEKEALRANRELIRATTIEDWLPEVSVGDADRSLLVDCTNVAVPRAELALGTMTVSGFDLADPGGLSAMDTLGVATDTDLTYASGERLYLASQESWWGAPRACFRCPASGPVGESTGVTHVYGFRFDGTAARYLGAGEVEGRIVDRWSMDEHDGVLRLAVSPSSETGNFNSVVTLRATDGRLEEVGRLDRLGVGEDIKSVRWFEDTAIVVTFRQIDPLYAIDLTDQRTPTLLGELKIPGFSEYLHPIGPKRLIGMGQGPVPERGWGAQAGLFNVEDLTDPQRVDLVNYERGSQARAGDDARQFTWLPDQRVALTVIGTRDAGKRAAEVSALTVAGDDLNNAMSEIVEYGSDVKQVRLVPLPEGRVVLVTGEGVEFFEVPRVLD